MQQSVAYTGLKSFEGLVVWQEARQLRIDMFALAIKLPSEEKYRLCDQLIRSSRSIGNNIAEGYGRYHYQEFIQFCRQSRGSLQETKDHLICAFDCKYIDQTTYNLHILKIDELNRKLNGFIKHLKSQQQTSHTK